MTREHDPSLGIGRRVLELLPLLAAFVLSASNPAFGSDSWNLPLFTASPQLVYEEAAKRPVPAGADVVTLEINVLIQLDREGRAHLLQGSVSRVLTSAGVRQLSTLTAHWVWRQAAHRA